MKIIVAQTAGFCMGVKRAVDQALSLSEDRSATTYTLGPLIHNKQTIEMLAKRGIRELTKEESELAMTNSSAQQTSHDTDNIGLVMTNSQLGKTNFSDHPASSDHAAPSPAGCNLLIRAHGVPPDIMEKYKAAGYNIVDGTCPKVKTVHKVIEKHRKLGYEIVVTGDEGHAEVIGLMGYAGDKGRLIQTPDDVDTLPPCDKICLVSQTTFDMTLFDVIAERIKSKFDGCDVIIKKTICSATNERQEETRELAEAVDALIVVGGKNSANTQRLAGIAQARGTHTQAVETAEEIDWEPIAKCKTVGVTAGASTPNWMIKRVCDHLQFLSLTEKKSVPGRIMRMLDAAANLNLIVAMGAAALYYVACVMQDMPCTLSGGMISLFYFIAAYLWNSLASREKTLHLDISKYRFYNRYPKRLLAISGASSIATLAFAWSVGTHTFLLMLFACVAGSMYHITIVPTMLRKLFPYKSLKDIPLSRDLFVALAWATILTLLPHVMLEDKQSVAITETTVAVFALIFMMSFTRSLIFDLRDIEGDRIMGRETLITIIGERRARKAIAVMIWGCATMLAVSPAIMELTAFGYIHAVPFLFLTPALVYAAIFVRHNARIRANHSALFCLLADGLFYIAALGAFLTTLIL